MAPKSPLPTGERLRREALRLFARQGYRGTTVEQIAAAAGVSHMTFFRHFPTKESVVVTDPYDPLAAEAVAATDRSLPAVERVRRGILAGWAMLPEPLEDETRLRISLIAAEPSLRAAMWEANGRTIDAIADALAADGVDRTEAAVAAGACLGALTVGLLMWGSTGEGPIGAAIESALDVVAPRPTTTTTTTTTAATRPGDGR